MTNTGSKLTNDQKHGLVFLLIKRWIKTPEKTFSQIMETSEGLPEFLLSLNLDQFLVTVFSEQKDVSKELKGVSCDTFVTGVKSL